MARKKTEKLQDEQEKNNGEEKMAKFGWCYTHHHDICKVTVGGWRCSCECHS